MTDRPHDSAAPNRDDETTEQLARDLHEQVRRLNHATAGAPGLTRPFTVYTILGDLSTAAHDLGRTSGDSGRSSLANTEPDASAMTGARTSVR